MAYHCKDCSYRGNKIGAGGECPACGSFDITRGGGVKQSNATPARWRLVLVTALWGILIVLIIRKLVS
ncbi:MAG: hypothetical protein Hals2KO_13640 [Halioglobus sp.]